MSELKIYTDSNIDTKLIKTKKIAIIGFGSQGEGQALNLRDSGCNIVLGLRLGGDSDIRARKMGFKTMSIPDAVQWADIVQILIPDEVQEDVFDNYILPNMHSGQYLMFSHGFNIHFCRIIPPAETNVIMVAPKGPGKAVRSEYLSGRGVPCLIAVEQDVTGDSKEVALSYASAIGAGRTGVLETTFKEETETDLFGEQSVICGGVMYLIRQGFEVLTEAGYSPYMAYFEVLHEMKLITDLINQGGLDYMRKNISNTAEYGAMTRGQVVIGKRCRNAMRKILKDIQDGVFTKEFINDMKHHGKHFNRLRTMQAKHPIEAVGKELRAAFNWETADEKEKTGELINV